MSGFGVEVSFNGPYFTFDGEKRDPINAPVNGIAPEEFSYELDKAIEYAMKSNGSQKHQFLEKVASIEKSNDDSLIAVTCSGEGTYMVTIKYHDHFGEVVLTFSMQLAFETLDTEINGVHVVFKIPYLYIKARYEGNFDLFKCYLPTEDVGDYIDRFGARGTFSYKGHRFANCS